MKRERQKEMVTEFEPTRWIVPELGELPTSMTLYPRVAVEDIDLPCVGDFPDSKLFHVDDTDMNIENSNIN